MKLSTTLDAEANWRRVTLRGVSILRERVMQIRKETGISSLADLADRAGISAKTLYAAFNRERDNGAHNIDQATARRLAEVGGKSIAWVMTGEDPSPAAKQGTDIVSMALDAVEMLVTIDEVPTLEALDLVRGISLHDPSTRAFYKAARLKHDGASGAVPGERVETADDFSTPPPKPPSSPTKRKRP